MGRSYAIAEKRMSRQYMEDTHTIITCFKGRPSLIFGGVYDGHKTEIVAKMLQQNMHFILEKNMFVGASLETSLRNTYAQISHKDWANNLTYGGACVATFLLQRKSVICANVGDCRILLVGKSIKQLTKDHTVYDSEERRRILEHGGYIEGSYVVCDEDRLMPTRVIGDILFRNVGVISEPFISRHPIKKSDKFLVAASDGLFEKVPNELVHKLAQEADMAQQLVDKLVQTAIDRESRDNLTIIVVRL